MITWLIIAALSTQCWAAGHHTPVVWLGATRAHTIAQMGTSGLTADRSRLMRMIKMAEDHTWADCKEDHDPTQPHILIEEMIKDGEPWLALCLSGYDPYSALTILKHVTTQLHQDLIVAMARKN